MSDAKSICRGRVAGSPFVSKQGFGYAAAVSAQTTGAHARPMHDPNAQESVAPPPELETIPS